jgi:phosphatidylglycerol:prolipoprotein diacylglycerol transferase
VFPTLQLGPLSIQVPGLVLLIGLWIGLSLSEKRAKQRNENPSYLYNLVFIAIIAGIIGARLSYVINYPEAFSSNLWSFFSINPGLLDPFAGFLIGGAAGLIYAYRKNIPLWSLLDSLTPLLAVMGIAIGASHYASGSAFGTPTDLPFGIHLWGETRHPTQIYEIILASGTLMATYFIDRSIWSRTPGNLFLSFLSLAAISRLVLEAFRGDSILVADGFRIAQIYAWLMLALCLFIISQRIYAQKHKDQGSL